MTISVCCLPQNEGDSMRIHRLVLTLFLAAVTAACAQAPLKPKLTDAGIADPASAIYIGNSFFYFNNSLHGHVGAMITEGMPGFRHRASSVTISGSGFDWHDVDSYFRPNAVGNYSFDASNNVNFNKLDRLFDVAIMMDCSQCPLHPQLAPVFVKFAKSNADTVRKHGAKPVYFMSWAYQDKPEMTAQLAEAYTREANANDALVIPAGLAFAKVQAERPEIGLYIADKRHPTLAGTYLAAAVSYAAVFGASPVDLPYTAGLEPKQAAYLQQVAWQTVRD